MSCGDDTTPVSSYSIGGSVSGLSGSLLLVNNDQDVLTVAANGTFKFADEASSGSEYAVVLATLPAGQVCTVANGSGVVAKANVTNVSIACAAAPEATLYAFTGGTDGSYPDSGLTDGADGNFYGTTTNGGASNLGTIYKVTPAGVHTVLYSFKGGANDGQYPASGLELGDDGDLYLTTTGGGAFGKGTFAKIRHSGVETLLYSFGAKGSETPQGLTLLDDGNFYGTTTNGGANGFGTVYRITAKGDHVILYSFAARPDGQSPAAGLSPASDGYLYGVTFYGGTNNLGTMFRIKPNGMGYASIRSFVGGTTDGSYPAVKLRNTPDGNLYGSTGSGGASDRGTLFKYNTATGEYSVIHSFAGGATDGTFPSCRLRVGPDGNLYGVSFYGGYFDAGTFFRITPAGVLTVVYSFSGGNSGKGPNSSLLVTDAGDFYGTTVMGGPTNNGTIYRIRP